MEAVLPPVIVCGMPRTGTTLIRRVLDSSPDPVIFREMGMEVVLPALELLETQKTRLADSPWLELTPADIERKVLVALRHLWEAGQGKGEPGYRGERRFGVKEPNLEVHRRRLDGTL